MLEFKRILYPTDFSPSGNRALGIACELARRFGAELHVMHVVQDIAAIAAYGVTEAYLPVEWRKEVKAQAEKSLLEVPDAAVGAGVNVVRVVAEGAPYYEILNYAKEQGVDLIVMGTHGRTGLPHMLMGSVAERVVREAPCAVMTIRPQ
ncbi:MAG: universal stress protein [Gammaproteobacteria bacterium]|nr:universal stress protein [Gammaproteobacteria bacterium]